MISSPIATTDSSSSIISSSSGGTFKSISMEENKCMISHSFLQAPPLSSSLHHEKKTFLWRLDDDNDDNDDDDEEEEEEKEEEEEAMTVPLWKYRQLEKEMQQMRQKMSTSIQKLEQQLDVMTLAESDKEEQPDMTTTTSSSRSTDSESCTTCLKKIHHLEKRFALYEELLRLKTMNPTIEKDQENEMMDFFFKEIEKTQVSLEKMMHLQSNSIQEIVEMDEKMLNLHKETQIQKKKIYETLRQMEKEKFEAEELKKEQFELAMKQLLQKNSIENETKQEKTFTKMTIMIHKNYINRQEYHKNLQEQSKTSLFLQKENVFLKEEMENLQKQLTSQKKTQQILIDEILKIKSNAQSSSSVLSSSYHQLKKLRNTCNTETTGINTT